MEPTNIPWEDKKPLPQYFRTVFTCLKRPYFREEKEFWEKNHKESDPLKRLILVFYNPQTGKTAYAIPDAYGYVHAREEVTEKQLFEQIGASECAYKQSLNTKQLRQNGYMSSYVTREKIVIDGKDCLLLRIYTMYCKVLIPRDEPDTLRESYRIIICQDNVWEETREGVCKSQWNEGGCGWNEHLSSARWYDEDTEPDDIKKLYQSTVPPLKHLPCLPPYELLTYYRRLPKKNFVYKSVPDDIKQDLAKQRPDGVNVWEGPGFLAAEKEDLDSIRVERMYVTKKKVYFFIQNPWTKQFCSSTGRRHKLIQKYTSTEYGKNYHNEANLTGIAALAAKIFEAHSVVYNVAHVLEEATRHVYVEQALKMGWYTAANQLSYLPKSTPNQNLADVLGVKGSMLKHIGDSRHMIEIANARENTARIISKAQQEGICPDLICLYNTAALLGTKVFELFNYYLKHGKPFGPFLYALRKNYELYKQRMFVDYYLDYISMLETLNRHETLFPQFLKPSEIDNMHSQAIASFRCIRDQALINKIAKKFDATVHSTDYQSFKMTDDEFCILTPDTPEDMIVEGSKMHHCVGSYIEKVANKLCKIFFLRHKAAPDTPYCTIELVNDPAGNTSMRQCYNAHNRHDNNVDRINFLLKWAKEKKVKIDCMIAPYAPHKTASEQMEPNDNDWIELEELLPFG